MGPKLMKCCKPEQMGTTEKGKNVEENSNSRKRCNPGQGGKKIVDRRTKEKNHEKGVLEACEKV